MLGCMDRKLDLCLGFYLRKESVFTNISMAKPAWETRLMPLNSLGSPSLCFSHFLFSLSYLFF